MGLLGIQDPTMLLNSVIYMLGKGLALHAGNEHRALKCLQFSDQLTFLHDEEGSVFVRYHEEIGFKTNKGGLKHRKVEPKVVDMYCYIEINLDPSKPKGMPLGLKLHSAQLHTASLRNIYIYKAKA